MIRGSGNAADGRLSHDGMENSVASADCGVVPKEHRCSGRGVHRMSLWLSQHMRTFTNVNRVLL